MVRSILLVSLGTLLVAGVAAAKERSVSPISFLSAGPSKSAPWIDLWEGSCELGANGTEGNSQTFDIVFGFDVKRETERNIISADLDYRKNSANSIETAHKGLLLGRYEHPFKDSPWTWFFDTTLEYDEFRAFDLRIAFSTGLGYRFIKTEQTSLIGRFGGGASHEIGGPDGRWVPEMVFAADLEHQLTERQKIIASVDYYPEITDFAAFRLNTELGWEVLLDEAMNLSMKVSLLDRYDNHAPVGIKPNDLDYAVTLLWGF